MTTPHEPTDTLAARVDRWRAKNLPLGVLDAEGKALIEEMGAMAEYLAADPHPPGSPERDHLAELVWTMSELCMRTGYRFAEEG